MHTLVTGGAGFIGSNVVRALLQSGHQVKVLDNLSSGYLFNLDSLADVRFTKGDVLDASILTRVIEGVEVVFHMAASVGNKRSLDNPVQDAEINLLGTLRLLEAARAAEVRKVIFSSSAAIFGELKTRPIHEEHPIEPITPYGVSKLAAEKACLAYVRFTSLECVCLRYFNVYGVNQRYDMYGNVIPIFAFQMLRGEPLTIFGDGEQTRDFLNVRDVAQANLKAATMRGVSGVFNIGSGLSISINHLVEALKRISGINPEVRYGAPRDGDVQHSLADISAARAAFGFEPAVAMDEGLRDYLTWVGCEVKRLGAG